MKHVSRKERQEFFCAFWSELCWNFFLTFEWLIVYYIDLKRVPKSFLLSTQFLRHERLTQSIEGRGVKSSIYLVYRYRPQSQLWAHRRWSDLLVIFHLIFWHWTRLPLPANNLSSSTIMYHLTHSLTLKWLSLRAFSRKILTWKKMKHHIIEALIYTLQKKNRSIISIIFKGDFFFFIWLYY